MFTKAPWFVVPLVWGPITLYILLRSMLQFTLGAAAIPPFMVEPRLPLAALRLATPLVALKVAGCFAFGNLVWTILEYIFHRFLFHVDEALPDHPAALTVHFLMHGVHHYLPMDRCVALASFLAAKQWTDVMWARAGCAW